MLELESSISQNIRISFVMDFFIFRAGARCVPGNCIIYCLHSLLGSWEVLSYDLKGFLFSL